MTSLHLSSDSAASGDASTRTTVPASSFRSETPKEFLTARAALETSRARETSRRAESSRK